MLDAVRRNTRPVIGQGIGRNVPSSAQRCLWNMKQGVSRRLLINSWPSVIAAAAAGLRFFTLLLLLMLLSHMLQLQVSSRTLFHSITHLFHTNLRFAHTLTLSLSLSLLHSLSLLLSLYLARSLAPSLSHTHAHTQSYFLAHPLTHSLTLRTLSLVCPLSPLLAVFCMHSLLLRHTCMCHFALSSLLHNCHAHQLLTEWADFYLNPI